MVSALLAAENTPAKGQKAENEISWAVPHRAAGRINKQLIVYWYNNTPSGTLEAIALKMTHKFKWFKISKNWIKFKVWSNKIFIKTE